VLVLAGTVPGWTQAFIGPVLVSSPHIFDSLVHLVLVGLFGHVSWHQEPESDILNFQFVEGGSHGKSSHLVSNECDSGDTGSELNGLSSELFDLLLSVLGI